MPLERTFERFDLDDLRSKVGKVLRASRPL
jgi:hypothetical protein